jgi:hypothetical protein
MTAFHLKQSAVSLTATAQPFLRKLKSIAFSKRQAPSADPLITAYTALNVTSVISVKYVMLDATNTAISADTAFLTVFSINHRYALFLANLPMFATVVENLPDALLKKLSIMQFPHRRNIRTYFLNPEKELISLKMRQHIWNKSSAL